MDIGMTKAQETKTIMEHSSLVHYTLTLAIVWTMAILFFTTWNIHQKKQTTRGLATKEARAHFNKDQAFRFWSTRHGGVYVPVNKRTQPNPYLKHIPERDAITVSGKKLTLMNPAYMLRQMMDEYSTLYEVKGRITSLKPFRPQNTPDEWERSALKAFESGVEEVFEFIDINSKPYLRLMRPMITKKGCLKCHGNQGYKVGDVRGGVGVSVSMSSYLVQEGREIRQLMTSYILIWLLGIGGIYLGFRGLKQRISERVQAEQALLESERKYRSMMEAMKDPSYICTPDYHVEYMNSAMINRTGHDATGESCFKSIHYLEEKCPWCLQDRIQQGKYCEQEVFSPKDNCTYHISNSPIVHVDGSISKMAVFRDITEFKLAEENVRQSEQRFRDLFESITDLIYTQDLDGRFISINPAMNRLFNYDMDEFIGHRATDFMKPEFQSGFKSRYLEVIKKQGHQEGIACYFKKNKGELYIEYKSSLVKPDNAEPYISGIGRDVTEKVLSEKKVEKLETQFQQAQKMEAIGVLAGGVAHDFNNILSIIIGNADLALMDADIGGSLQEEIDEIKTAGERGASLTRQLLAFSRKQVIRPEILNLNKLLAGIEKMLVRLIGEDVEILKIIEPALWRVKIDPGQMEQVIMNLAINARDAMHRGGKLTIETNNEDIDENYFYQHSIEGEPGSYVMIAVSDTGIGMDKEVQKHIFEPFYTTKKKGRGTGLGLSTIYGIIKQNNGLVWVYSEPGQGSTFKVYLPKSEEEGVIAKKEKKPVIKLGGSETILIVEDDDALRNLVRVILKKNGYKVLTAENGEAALRVNKEHDGQIDLLLTDVVMPKMDGEKTAKFLEPLHPRMKTIYMSGYTDNAVVYHGILEAGLNFIQKPFSLENLALMVRQVLDKKQDQ